MKKLLRLMLAPIVLFGLFGLWAPTLINSAQSHEGMAGMDHAAVVSQKNVQCQAVCNSIPPSPSETIVRENVDETRNPEDFSIALSFAILGTLIVGFCVKIIIGLSSWRPPDKVLLFGHYADGL